MGFDWGGVTALNELGTAVLTNNNLVLRNQLIDINGYTGVGAG